jgi:hypothetical protein
MADDASAASDMQRHGSQDTARCPKSGDLQMDTPTHNDGNMRAAPPSEDMRRNRLWFRCKRGVRWLAAAATVAIVASAATTGANAQISEPGLVGAGSMTRDLRCPPRSLLIGFNMRTGDLLDAIQPICDEVTPNVSGLQDRPVVLSLVGGEGGGWQQMRCLPGYAVTNLFTYVDENIRGNGQNLPPALNHIRLGCAPFPNMDGYYEVTPSFGGRYSSPGRLICSPGQWITGIRYGSDAHVNYERPEVIDTLGVLCGPLPPRILVDARPEISDMPVDLTRPIEIDTILRQTRTVRLATDVYDHPGSRRIGVLQVGETVTLRERCQTDNWCRIRTAQFPDGWVYSGPDYNSLGL